MTDNLTDNLTDNTKKPTQTILQNQAVSSEGSSEASPEGSLRTINVDGTEYLVSDLSPIALRYLNHLISIKPQIEKLQFELEQALGTQEFFTGLLREQLPVAD